MQQVWKRQCCLLEWVLRFFRISLFHENLENYFKTNFLLMQEHKYSLTEIESWIPWERQVYISMLVSHIKKRNEEMKKSNWGQ